MLWQEAKSIETFSIHWLAQDIKNATGISLRLEKIDPDDPHSSYNIVEYTPEGYRKSGGKDAVWQQALTLIECYLYLKGFRQAISKLL